MNTKQIVIRTKYNSMKAEQRKKRADDAKALNTKQYDERVAMVKRHREEDSAVKTEFAVNYKRLVDAEAAEIAAAK